jgi:hypothetical protein
MLPLIPELIISWQLFLISHPVVKMWILNGWFREIKYEFAQLCPRRGNATFF